MGAAALLHARSVALAHKSYRASVGQGSAESGARENTRRAMSIVARRDFYTFHSILFVTSGWGIGVWGDQNP